MKTYEISLKGLGYKAQRAVVKAMPEVETGDIFPVLEGLPTIRCVSIELDVRTGTREDHWAENAAWSLAFDRFQRETGLRA